MATLSPPTLSPSSAAGASASASAASTSPSPSAPPSAAAAPSSATDPSTTSSAPAAHPILPSLPTLPLTYASLLAAHTTIRPLIHETPVLTSASLNALASAPQTAAALVGTPWEGHTPARPTFHFFFKAENFQTIGAFKIRGASHAVARLVEAERGGTLGEGKGKLSERGVLTHSSGNHAQALALAARRAGFPAHIIMPTISQPAKIAATQSYGAHVYFSGSTEPERAALAAEVQATTDAVFVPPYDHPHIILGQGTLGLEMEDQVADILEDEPPRGAPGGRAHGAKWPDTKTEPSALDAVIAPLGGGGMLAGVALAFEHAQCWVFGAEPSHGGADDGRRGLAAGARIASVSSLTVADGLRTPVGEVTWTIIADERYVRGVYAVSDAQILAAMRLVLERMKVVVEPSAAVGLAVALFDEGFRRVVQDEGGAQGWNVGVVFSGGNTTVEAMGRMFGQGTAGERGK